MTEVDKLKKRWFESDEAEINTAISALLEHRHGRRLLWWLLEIGGVGRQPFAANALHTAFNCGELNIGQRVLDRIISVSPQGYVTMMKENADERDERNRALSGAVADAANRAYSRADDRADFDDGTSED